MNINGIASNCGIITPQIFQSCSVNGQAASVTNNHIPYFNSLLCQWAYNIPNKFSWVMIINAHNRNFLLNKIKQIVPSYEPPGWNIKTMADATWTQSTQDVIGCVFAQGVSLPGESVSVDYVGITEGSKRGFINSPIINGRNDYPLMRTGFLETNKSFVDGVLRPWSIALAHEGLIARPRERSIKSDIFIYQLAKSGECSPNIIRKAFILKNCAPVSISEEELIYSNDSDYPKMQVEFVFSSYSITSFDDQGAFKYTPSIPESQITMSQQAVRENIERVTNLI